MIRLPGGTFLMGTDDGQGFREDGEGPVRKITLDPFFISPYATTNAEFSAFVEETGYETEAERFGWSFVFYRFLSAKAKKKSQGVGGQRPLVEGRRGSLLEASRGAGVGHQDPDEAPRGPRLPQRRAGVLRLGGKEATDRGRVGVRGEGRPRTEALPLGRHADPRRGTPLQHLAGGVPDQEHPSKTATRARRPWIHFPPNGFGLYNVSGNVWEWCQDWFSATFHVGHTRENPTGPPAGTSRVIRGGSYLCHKSYCNRYRVAARSSNTPDSSTGNSGFRCAADA